MLAGFISEDVLALLRALWALLFVVFILVAFYIEIFVRLF